MKKAKLDPSIFEIHRDLLIDEWEQQGKFCYMEGEKLESAKKRTAIAETNLNRVRAKIDLAIRRNPKKYGIEKFSEKAVASALELNQEYQKAYEELIECRRVEGGRTNVMRAIEHRKKALEKAVDLHGQQYFRVPRPSKNAKESFDQMNKRHIRRG